MTRESPDLGEDYVLVVDDDAGMRSSLVDLLEAAGVRARTAAGGRDALHMVTVSPPTLALVDHWMLDMTGIDLAERIKELDAELPVVLLTGHASLDTAVRAVGVVDEFLIKPVPPEQLIRVVDAFRERVRLRRENVELLARLAHTNARLEATLDQRTQELARLAEFAQGAGRASSLEETLREGLAAVGEAVGSGFIAFYLAIDDAGPLALHTTLGSWSTPAVLPRPASAVSQDVVGTPPQWVTVVSVTAAGELVGLLLVANEKHGSLRFLRTIAAQLGVAIVSAQRFERERETVERLSELARLKSDFLASVSHELRTPLTAVLGFAQTLMTRELPDATRRELLARVVEQGDRLRRLVDDLLDATTLERGGMAVTVAPVAVAPMLRRVAQAFPGDGHRVEITIPADLPAVPADETRLEQVLTNLVHNAMKYSPEGTAVYLTAEVLHDEVRLSVRDEGPGIESAFLPRLFEAFTQADSGDTRRHSGVGLGLYITRGLVEAMGGRIDVDSTVGVGTSFHVTLPTVSAAARSGPPPGSVRARAPHAAGASS